MTRIPTYLVTEFQEYSKKEFDDELTYEEAERVALWLVNFLGSIATARARQISKECRRP